LILSRVISYTLISAHPPFFLRITAAVAQSIAGPVRFLVAGTKVKIPQEIKDGMEAMREPK
jgi:hypothetical protein